jgi:hypothetical protein
MSEIRVFDTPQIIKVDWEYAIDQCRNIDRVESDENRLPITGKAAVLILAEYGSIAYKCAYVPSDINLAVIVCPPCVWFCPSKERLDGVFIEEYSEERFGGGLKLTKIDCDLFSYSSIEARLDGWHFAAWIISEFNKIP